MTHSSRNFVFAYVLLVALPLFGLAGVLRAGRQLAAPVSVAGVWKITNSDQLAANPCAKVLGTPNAAFTISQSGRMFTLSVPNPGTPASSGTIDGTAINANLTSASSAKDPACSVQLLLLSASVDTETTPRSIEGVLHVETCPSCKPVEFRAIREEQPKAKEAR